MTGLTRLSPLLYRQLNWQDIGIHCLRGSRDYVPRLNAAPLLRGEQTAGTCVMDRILALAVCSLFHTCFVLPLTLLSLSLSLSLSLLLTHTHISWRESGTLAMTSLSSFSSTTTLIPRKPLSRLCTLTPTAWTPTSTTSLLWWHTTTRRTTTDWWYTPPRVYQSLVHNFHRTESLQTAQSLEISCWLSVSRNNIVDFVVFLTNPHHSTVQWSTERRRLTALQRLLRRGRERWASSWRESSRNVTQRSVNKLIIRTFTQLFYSLYTGYHTCDVRPDLKWLDCTV